VIERDGEMPKKYHIYVQEAPHRYPIIGRSGIVDWGEGCLRCPQCVKQECVYDVYRKRTFSVDIMSDTIDELCKNCFRCVQSCPKRLIHKTINPEWEALGDDLYTPEVISITWEQARSGKIPVSGAGYGGPYAGPGFDSMWTDMSEIVRPTRDGIHGREYISTVVDIGRRLARLRFDESGSLISMPGPSISVPIPIVFDVLPFGDLSAVVRKAVAKAASVLGTRAVLRETDAREQVQFRPWLVPLLDAERWDPNWSAGFEMVEIPGPEEVLEKTRALKEINPALIVAVRMPALLGNAELVTELARSGVEVIHLVAGETGYEPGAGSSVHVKQVIRETHGRLIEAGIRDEITFIVSGGIALAEHVIKSMLCGTDLVGVDAPLLIALECRVCRNCVQGGDCPVRIATIDPDWGSRRIVNLMGAWHNQLLEMMGAMGIREARRLRGERGRVMFFEDLEVDTFGRLFGDAGL